MLPSEAGAFPEPHCCSGAWGSLPDTPGCWGAASPHPSRPTSHCQDLPSSPRQPRGHQPTPTAGGSPHPRAVRPGVSGYQLTGAPWQDRAARPPPAPRHPWVHAEHQDEPSAGRSLLRAGSPCSRSPFPAGVFPWPGNRLAQPAASPGTITRLRCSRPSLPQGFLPGVWLALPTETRCLGTASVLGPLQLGCWAPTPAGQGAQTRGSPPLSSPRSPGRALLPSPLCFKLRSLARACQDGLSLSPRPEVRERWGHWGLPWGAGGEWENAGGKGEPRLQAVLHRPASTSLCSRYSWLDLISTWTINWYCLAAPPPPPLQREQIRDHKSQNSTQLRRSQPPVLAHKHLPVASRAGSRYRPGAAPSVQRGLGVQRLPSAPLWLITQ